MSLAYYYQYIYLILIALLTFVAIRTNREPDEVESIVPSVLLCIFLVFFIGFRPLSGVFVDMVNYADEWRITEWSGIRFDTDNLVFDNILYYMAGTGVPMVLFFLLLSCIYFTFMLVACRKLFPNHTLLAFLVCLAAFSTFSYATNGIKAGAAASLFLVAMAYRDRKWISLLFLLLSWGFHHSMVVPVVAYALTLFFKNCNWYFFGWIFCLLMAIAHISYFQDLFAGFSDAQGAGYLNPEDLNWGGKTGFRLDFVVYSAMPVLMGFFVKYKYQLEDELYDIMLNMYMACNGIWMLCMYAAFTNRIAYLSWFMYPILIVYPCLRITDQEHPLVMNRNKFILCHLGFTLFMVFIYYA